MPYRLATVLLLCAVCHACIPPSGPAEDTAVTTDLADSLVQRVYDLQNHRAEDSLAAYLAHDRTDLRFLAARGLGSFPTLSDRTVDTLLSRLDDPAVAVRTQVAYALGQTGRPELAGALTAAFDRTGAYPDFDAAVLQATGRTGDLTRLEQLAGAATYTATDTVLQAGQRWGLYYGALRGVRTKRGDDLMLATVLDPGLPAEVRHPAAHYLYRIDFPVDTAAERRLRQQLRAEEDPVVAMGLIRSLGRTGLPPARVALLAYYESSEDWRTRVEVLRAFAGFEYAAVRESVVEALRDPHPLVARTATDYLIEHGTAADAPLYLQLAEDDLPPELRIELYRAANRHLSPFLTDYRDRIIANLQTTYAEDTDPYHRAAALRAMGEFPWMYRILAEHYRDTDSPVVRTAVAETLQSISEREDFEDFFRGSAGRVRTDLAELLRELIESGEAGPAYHAGLALATSPGAYRAAFPEVAWLDSALARLELPRQIETYREVLAARNTLAETQVPEPPATAAGAREIDWDRLADGPAPAARIRTGEGVIRIRLWPDVAPATVSSFLKLAKRGYYDGKVFHRVVPNFVAQGGGPRGDGFGSENFIVRTETPPLHWDRAGLVGMASAGKDTEGVQFFITHRPTPHLDGNYTIFGEVMEGQDVVDRLVPGSRILQITTE
ncbi:peptidylprolyl isomerase [Lewinella sp. IMCC34183]|uniref:peptidylprolyl isomerase n=1 Tax=Lewinella sp. IMCC34183 TaxID=2248762 RepID=UPI000E27AF93|nr:peptidylprolyl isomerase [Lewinella sp. IMCC34183]